MEYKPNLLLILNYLHVSFSIHELVYQEIYFVVHIFSTPLDGFNLYKKQKIMSL